MKHRESEQRELAYRASDRLPFVDQRVIDGVIRTIMFEMYSIRDRTGSVIYPYGLSNAEERGVRRLLGKHNSGLLARIEGFVPVRLEEGMGTEILIKKKGKG